jgi:Na+/melibiose symporter-like transporter
MLQQIALGGAMIALPIFLQMVLEYNALQAGLSLAPLSLSMFAVAMLAGRRAGRRRPATVIRVGFILVVIGMAALLPVVPRADSGLWLAIPLVVAGCGFGLLVSQLNNFTLAPISSERISEAAGVNSAAGSFGLSFGLALAGGLMLASLAVAFTSMAEASPVFTDEQAQQVATGLEEDAQLLSNSQLEELIVNQPPEIEDEIIRINTEARPLALQIALLVPLIAGLIGTVVSFRMVRLPDIEPAADLEGVAFD